MEEWREVLADAWRQARDAFWDAGMGGIDWLSVHAAYESQLPRVGCTSELYDLIRRMYAELRVLHTCAYPPALAASVRSNALAMWRPSFLGGVLRAAADGRGGVEVCELYCGDHERQQLSPLVMPHYGLPLREGERIGEINGVACHTLAALGEALRFLGRQRSRCACVCGRHAVAMPPQQMWRMAAAMAQLSPRTAAAG